MVAPMQGKEFLLALHGGATKVIAVGATSPEQTFLNQGLLGALCIVMAGVILYLYRHNTTSAAAVAKACEDKLAAKDNEIKALYDKLLTETVPLLTRAVAALERKRV